MPQCSGIWQPRGQVSGQVCTRRVPSIALPSMQKLAPPLLHTLTAAVGFLLSVPDNTKCFFLLCKLQRVTAPASAP